MDFGILHCLHTLEHSKIHHIGNKSERRLIILQGMAVGISQCTVFLESGERMFDFDPYFPLLGVMDFLGMGEFLVFSGSFVRNERRHLGEILLDSLVSRITIEPQSFGDDLGKDGLLEELVVVHPAGNRLADVYRPFA